MQLLPVIYHITYNIMLSYKLYGYKNGWTFYCVLLGIVDGLMDNTGGKEMNVRIISKLFVTAHFQ